MVKAVKSDGSLDIKIVNSLLNILPDKIIKKSKTALQSCVTKHAKNVSDDEECESYIPFANCFFDVADKVNVFASFHPNIIKYFTFNFQSW